MNKRLEKRMAWLNLTMGLVLVGLSITGLGENPSSLFTLLLGIAVVYFSAWMIKR